jgi:signal transduction histidine kinase
MVVSDYQMPELDGIEFLQHLRKEHPALPFIMFTGNGREEIAIAAFENGADFYIRKGGNPVAQFAELAHKIRKSVEQRKAREDEFRKKNKGLGAAFDELSVTGEQLRRNMPHPIKNLQLPMAGETNYRTLADTSGHKHDEEALRITNRKLQLLSSITRHDIRNQVLALRSALDLIDTDHLDQDTRKLIGIARKAAETIDGQIGFTNEYEHLGVKEPRWQNVSEVFRHATHNFLMCDISLDLPADGYEIFADPLLEKVFYNLLDNALRHGGDVTRISLSCRETDGVLKIFMLDNGHGVPDEDKPRIFEQDFGRNTGLGLFLSREILSMTGISIAETGTFGKGARFEFTVPKGRYQFTGSGAPS